MTNSISWVLPKKQKNAQDRIPKYFSHYNLPKAMTNLDSILKSRDIALPIKVRLVKAMVFPVVMCGCESWAIKKAAAAAAKSLQLCPALCNPIDG